MRNKTRMTGMQAVKELKNAACHMRRAAAKSEGWTEQWEVGTEVQEIQDHDKRHSISFQEKSSSR